MSKIIVTGELNIKELADKILSQDKGAEMIKAIDASYQQWEFTQEMAEWFAAELAKEEE